MLLSEGNLNKLVGASLTLDAMPRARLLVADKGHEGDDFREAFDAILVTRHIASRLNRKVLIAYDNELYKTPHKIENLSGKIKRLEAWGDKV